MNEKILSFGPYFLALGNRGFHDLIFKMISIWVIFWLFETGKSSSKKLISNVYPVGQTNTRVDPLFVMIINYGKLLAKIRNHDNSIFGNQNSIESG